MFLHSLALLLVDSIISSGSFSAGSSYFCFFFSVCGGACSLLLGFSPFLCYCPSAWKVLTVLCVRVWSEDPYIAFWVGCDFFFAFSMTAAARGASSAAAAAAAHDGRGPESAP